MVEEVAGDHLGIGVSSAGLERVLGQLYSERGHRGLLVHYNLEELQHLVLRCRRVGEDFFASVRDIGVTGQQQHASTVSADDAVRAAARANLDHCLRVSHAAGGSGVLIVVGADGRPRLERAGHYEDTLVRERGEWKFKSRQAFTEIN